MKNYFEEIEKKLRMQIKFESLEKSRIHALEISIEQ